MKLALLTDTHFGARNDALMFQDFFNQFYGEVFFPALRERGIKTVVHLGDLLDRRKFINFAILNRVRTDFVDRIVEDEIDLHCIIGNHDTFFKNTNEVNSVQELFRDVPNFKIYSDPATVRFDGVDLLFLPWINSSNYERSLAAVEESKAVVCMGHLELQGFEMYRGTKCEHGMSRETFSKFHSVFSGHFHHRSTQGNIHYLGSPYEMTFADMEDSLGFHIFDTEDLSLEFIPNPYRMFFRVVYDDHTQEPGQLMDVDPAQYKDKFLKIVVKSKSDPYLFEKYLDRIYASNPADTSIMEGYSADLDDVPDSEKEFVIEDTLTVLNTYVDNIDMDVDRDKLKEVLRELYVESLSSGKEN